MDNKVLEQLPNFLEVLGLNEYPLGTFFTSDKPKEGYSPKPMELPTVEKEKKNEVDWQSVFSGFSCAFRDIWLARKKKAVAYFSAEQFGCVGAAYYFGYVNPLPETIIHYISSGIPNVIKGEMYHESPDVVRNMLKQIAPKTASEKFCVFKPLDNFEKNENPELVSFFIRPEVLSGLHRLVTYATNDPEAVVSPWSAACGSLVARPLYYLSRGLNKAVIGSMDPPSRKYLKTDELTFTVPFEMFTKMLNCFNKTFLKTDTWTSVKKKIALSKKTWGEKSNCSF